LKKINRSITVGTNIKPTPTKNARIERLTNQAVQCPLRVRGQTMVIEIETSKIAPAITNRTFSA
jgi:hypothetical protein